MNNLSLRKKILYYWLPPLLLMAIIFPVGNRTLGSHHLYQLFSGLFRMLDPDASASLVRLAYIIIRKSFHFLAYGCLAYFFFRAFRGASRVWWKSSWALGAGVMAACYGMVDELLQTIVPNRSGRPFDWLIDVAGITTFMVITTIVCKKKASAPTDKAAGGATLFVKRSFDILLSLFGLAISSPLWAVIALLIIIEDRGAVFYAQERMGRNGRVFKAFKFRSMVPDAENGTGPVQASARDPRVTRIGRVLRATAMDELPQLLNILKGDMSFVGPRALRPAEKEVRGDPGDLSLDMIPGFAERHTVRPGLTGLAQVYLPGEAPRRRKFKYDLLYVRRMNFALDLKLIFLSFWITFRGKWEAREDKV
jgi:lipopolysaccharide/colanic/teichoic acid biosynthesis glycosyltransferase